MQVVIGNILETIVKIDYAYITYLTRGYGA